MKENTILYDVFISYRRKGGAEEAQLVKSELQQRGLPDERIFLDTHSLHEGNFEERIRNAIASSQNVIVVISLGCFDEKRQTDYWHMEIREALRQGKNIVPILFDSIISLNSLNVPDDLAALKEKNCVTYQHEYANAAFDKLYTFLGLELTSNLAKRRGCMMKYRGCMFTVVLAFVGLFILVPSLYFFLDTSSSEGSSKIVANAKEKEDDDGEDDEDDVSKKKMPQLDNYDADRYLAAEGEPERTPNKEEPTSASAAPTTTGFTLKWAKYEGTIKNRVPHGMGELRITQKHRLGNLDVETGEVIKGRFDNGAIAIAQLHKQDGTIITLRNIKLLE